MTLKNSFLASLRENNKRRIWVWIVSFFSFVVVLPSILSTIVIMLITRIGSLLNVGYEKVLLLYNPKTYVTADVVSTFAQRYGIADGLVGLASAAEMLNNVVGMLLVIAANTIARKASDVSLY